MKITKFLFPIVFGIGVIFSCNREGNETINEGIVTNRLHGEASRPDYSKNYLGSVGVIHNEVLTKVLLNKNQLITMDDYISYSIQVFETDYNFSLYYSDLLSNNDIKEILNDRDNSYHNTIQNTQLSVKAKEYLTNLISLIETLSEENENELEYSFVKNRITDFEDYVLLDGNLNTSEKNIILTVSSVARYSSFFWYNEYQLYLNSGGYDNVSNPQNPKQVEKKWWKWLAVAVSDVAGAVAGGIAGSTGGPVGTTAGAIAGATGASSGAASLVDWVQQ